MLTSCALWPARPSGHTTPPWSSVRASWSLSLPSWRSGWLPFSPVPITGQTLAVLLAGALLGSRRGAMSMLAYLAQGIVGLPVFAQGASGITYLAGPTGGYLIGFVAAAYITGWLAERGWDRHVGTTALAMLAGNLAIYAVGLSWLSLYVGRQAIALGLLPYAAGDVLKLALAALSLPAGWKLIRK